MSAMNQVDIARIDPQRVAQVVTNRLVAIPVMPKLLALPIFLAAAAALYGGIAPLWMFAVPAVIYLVSVWGSWRVTVEHDRNPAAASLLFAVSLGSAFGLWYLSRLSRQLVESTAI